MVLYIYGVDGGRERFRLAISMYSTRTLACTLLARQADCISTSSVAGTFARHYQFHRACGERVPGGVCRDHALSGFCRDGTNPHATAVTDELPSIAASHCLDSPCAESIAYRLRQHQHQHVRVSHSWLPWRQRHRACGGVQSRFVFTTTNCSSASLRIETRVGVSAFLLVCFRSK